MTSCLDSWAILRWLEGAEPARSRVEDVLADERPVVSWINLGEVFYISWRAGGEDLARSVIDDLRRLTAPDEATPERVLQAASVKAVHPMAYADAFAVATARAHGASLLTGDPEILDIETDWDLEDLR
ncbi:type II toxin-antitoxin system VapC family toxin [soil metagenome]